jgi:hypothetical protein
MKYNINVIKSVWRRWRKPSQATLDAIGSHSARSVMIDGRRTPRDAKDAMYEADGRAERKAQRMDSQEWKRLTETLHPTVWQHVTQLEADHQDMLIAAKAVVRSRDINVERRPSSVSINVLRDTIERLERGKPGVIRKEEEKAE